MMLAITTIAEWSSWIAEGLRMEADGPTLTWDSANNPDLYHALMTFLFALIGHEWLQHRHCLGLSRC